MIDLGIRMRHLLAQDSSINSEARCSLVIRALEGYNEQYHAHINALQQRQITKFLRRRAETQPAEPQPGPSQEKDFGDNADYFEGFEIQRRLGGQ
ncbi:uncharacterized protein LOC143023496 [Oratosquilla oratoria]|uniref:uncharacterized protein LOC143023496 n=1 Tax=Oratosquilla oratoria TaxID=337810 RepID=UPI003F75ABC3